MIWIDMISSKYSKLNITIYKKYYIHELDLIVI